MSTNTSSGTGQTSPSSSRSSRTTATPYRGVAMTAGVMYLITIVASIPAQFINYAPILNNPDYVLGAGADTRVMWGGLLEVVAALACIGTAVVLYPVVRRQHEGAALGFVTARVLEAALIVTGVVAMLSVVTLREPRDGAEGVTAWSPPRPSSPFTTGPSSRTRRDARHQRHPARLRDVPLRARTAPHPGHRPHRRAVLPPRRRCQHRRASTSRFGVDRARHPAHLRLGGRLGVYLTVKGFRPDAVRRLDGREGTFL